MTRLIDSLAWTPRPHLALWLLIALLLLTGCGRDRAQPDATPTPAGSTAGSASGDAAANPLDGTPDPNAPPPLATALGAQVPTAPPVTPSPTPIPEPEELLAIGRELYRIGNYPDARDAFQLLLTGTEAEAPLRLGARYELARTQLAEGAYSAALATLDQLDAEVRAGPDAAADPALNYLARDNFLRARAHAALDNPNAAIQAYWAFLESYPWMAEAIQPRIADLYLALGDVEGALTALRRAADGATDRTAKAQLLERLAESYSSAARYAEAASVYGEILDFAQEKAYRAGIAYAAGLQLVAAGNTPGAIERFRQATAEEPTARAAYLALVELVNRNVDFDLYQRGYIDLMAEAYLPAINAYEGYLEGAATTDARYAAALHELGQSYLGAGDPASALPLFDRLIAEFPECDCFGQAWLDKARAQAAAGEGADARRTYRTFARDHGTNPLAGDALWASGWLALNEGNEAEAAVDFLALAEMFPNHVRAPEGLYILATGAWRNEFYGQAAALYARLLDDYPNFRFPAVAYWMGRAHEANGDLAAAERAWQGLVQRGPDTYYGVIAAFTLRDIPLVNAAHLNRMNEIVGPRSRLQGDDGSQAFAEAWLKRWEPFAALDNPSALPIQVSEDPDLAKGALLLQLDMRPEGLDALDRVLRRYRNVPAALYPLSLEFARMGAYRQSIESMRTLLGASPATLVEDAPIFLQTFVYPLHFEVLIGTEAQAHDIDPFLYFSMIRQESLFEEGARSWAAAQGLAQIIPDTARWVAERQGHADWSNELIYRPYINVNFGAYYFDWVRDYLDGNEVSALVGYNAGPGNAAAWRERSGPDDALFVEILTINEPRLYVTLITENLYHYTRLYGQ